MRILLPTLHVRQSAQAIPLAAGNLKASLPAELQKQTELLDLFPQQSLTEMAKCLLSRSPQLIAFPLYLWNRQQVLRLCRHLRRQQPDLFLIAGGPEASAEATKVIDEGELDGVICGEGELPFAQLATLLSQGQQPAAISGFQSAVGSEQPIEPAVCSDLTRLKSPWLTEALPLQEDCGVLWEVARGCRFNCAFCYDAKGHQGVRPLPLKRLQAELQLFVEKKVAQIWILDSTFNAPPERGKQLLGLLIEQAPLIHFHLEAKADFLDVETAELLSQLSCSVQIGLQSAEPEVLEPLHRSLKVGQMTQALQQLSQAGVTYGLDLIYGLPGDNHSGFCSSLDFALQQQPNQVDIFPLAVLPGTELHQQHNEFGLKADPQPPYLVRENSSYSATEMALSKRLATATDIFYNRGRSVGFFLQICEALAVRPADLLEQFSYWLSSQPVLSTAQQESADAWQPAEIFSLQQQFIAERLRSAGREKLLRVAEDLLNYHFNCAEVLLAGDCRPVSEQLTIPQMIHRRWRLNPAVQIQKFNYDLEELEEVGGEKLSWLVKHLTAESCFGIFLQQQGQPVVESIMPEFAGMLLAADGQQTTKQLLADIDKSTANELLQFAISQGILQPAT